MTITVHPLPWVEPAVVNTPLIANRLCLRITIRARREGLVENFHLPHIFHTYLGLLLVLPI